MSFSVTILGSSSALPTSKRFPSAHAINLHEHFFLIDCGEGTQMQLRKFKIKLGRLNHIFISHLHGDHVFGLPGLFSTFSLLGRKSDLFVHGHAELKKLIDFYTGFFGKDIQFNIVFQPFGTRRQELIFENKQITVHTIPLKHRVPACGFLFKEKEKTRNLRKDMIDKYKLSIKDIVKIKSGEDYVTGDGSVVPNSILTLPPLKPRSYAYCSDTVYLKKIAGLIKDVDILYHEATFLEKDKDLAKLTLHSTAKQAASIAKEANAGRLLIGHFSSRYDNTELFEKEAAEIFENTEAVEDGNQYVIEQTRTEILNI